MAAKKADAASSPELAGPDVTALMSTLIRAEEDNEGKPMKLMTPGGAQLLVAYLLARKTKMPADILVFARQLRGQHPMTWKPLLAMNYIGFAHALGLCSLEVVPAAELQNACSALAAA